MMQARNSSADASTTGSLAVITGSMFSGKTEELIRRLRRALYAHQRVQVFKHALDTRSELTQRLIDGKPAPTILVGAQESYEARCHEV